MDDTVDTPEVRFSVERALGTVTLDRPRALNALTHRMVVEIAAHLDEWETDPQIERVLIQGAGDRAFCAGGDIVGIYRDAVGGGGATEQFWRDEYTLNARIARYPKPIVTVMDGIVLGGGVGLGAHASHRIVTETSSVGMPEPTIGFVPDVGGTWLLSRAPGELGTRLALTAGSTDAAGAIHLGLADSFVPRDRLAELREALTTHGADESIARVAEEARHPQIVDDQVALDECFALDDVASILAALRDAGYDDLTDAIESKSPSALVLTLASLRRARSLPDLESALTQEFRVSVRCLGLPDLAEGIRAQVIDKDRSPRWNPASLADVDADALAAFFDPLPHDLILPNRKDLQ
ncbi:enoyl-CoA hydratase [Leifsonia sp. AK011]|uniref:3-hydroxyisobutyryl-CoA hydrolase n=1 Tax=Leifsonia sp. AK011 TaxID=2723075 RepID=UPI0015C9F693|nr:3-hydroxyisobutyryl-CoA hydrolase [Leifsonia sp. AK011]NYF11347.1 enoyl-CoA hydratase [Leifsonia sp. AK011]